MTPAQVDALLETLGRDPAMAEALKTGVVSRAELASRVPRVAAAAKQKLYKLLASKQSSKRQKSYAAVFQQKRGYTSSKQQHKFTSSRIGWAAYKRPRMVKGAS